MDPIETLVQSAQGLYVLLVSFGRCGGLKMRTAHTATSTTAKVGSVATLRMYWGLTNEPVPAGQHDCFDILRLSARVRRRGEMVQSPRLCILTHPSQRFGTFGEVARRGVRPAICTNHIEN